MQTSNMLRRYRRKEGGSISDISMKWVIKSVLITGMLLTVIGCGNRNVDEKIHLTFTTAWVGPETRAVYRDILNEFEAIHGNVRVRYIPHVPSPKLITMLAGRSPLDVISLSEKFFVEFALRGKLLALDSFINDDKDFSSDIYYDRVFKSLSYLGRQYGLPAGFSTVVLFYNKDLFDKSQIAYPDESWTWQHFRDAAIALTKDKDNDGRIDQFGCFISAAPNRFPVWIWQNDGELTSDDLMTSKLDMPESIEAIQFLVDLLLKYRVTPTSFDMSARGLNEKQLFQMGKVAMTFMTTFQARIFGTGIERFNWDVAHLPKGKQRATTLITSGYFIPAPTEHPDLAWELAKFVSNKRNMQRLTEASGAIPPIKELAESFLSQPWLPENKKVFLEAVEYARLPILSVSDVIFNQVAVPSGWELMWMGRISVAEGMSRMARGITEEAQILAERHGLR